MARCWCIVLCMILPGVLGAQVLPVRNAPVAAGFLSIAPDAVSGAMGNTGVSGSGDVFSLFHNPAKYSFSSNDGGVAVFYNPWGTSYAKDLGLSGGTAFLRRKRNVFSVGFRYFSYGSMDLTDDDAVVVGHVQPYELAADLAYSLQLSSRWSGSVGFKYIYSYLGRLALDGNGGSDKGAGAYAFDVSFFFRNAPDKVLMGGWTWSVGFRAENIGSKLSYQKEAEGYFLPAKMRVGGTAGYKIHDHNLSFACDIEKLLVPIGVQAGRYRDRSPVANIGKSFSGFSWNELGVGLGVEYAYQDYFKFRGGYHYEDAAVGNQRFISFGCGGGWRGFQVDFAYLYYTGKTVALDNMLKVSCGYSF